MTDTTKVRRLWNNKLSRIDSLMSWMYDEGIFNKGEKAKKDSIFRRYYRYYNDGDFPRGVPGISSWMGKTSIEEALEVFTEDFIKKMLNKYWSKIDRAEYRFAQAMDKLKTVLQVINNEDVHGLVNYWKKDITGSYALELTENLNTKYLALKEATGNLNLGMTYQRRNMLEAGTWTREFEVEWNYMMILMVKISNELRVTRVTIQNERRLQTI